jgi:hypothetical protein
MRLCLIIHVKRCQDKNMTCHGNPSPSNRVRGGVIDTTDKTVVGLVGPSDPCV